MSDVVLIDVLLTGFWNRVPRVELGDPFRIRTGVVDQTTLSIFCSAGLPRTMLTIGHVHRFGGCRIQFALGLPMLSLRLIRIPFFDVDALLAPEPSERHCQRTYGV